MHDLFSLQIAYKEICESVLCKKDLGQLMHRFCMKKKKKKKKNLKCKVAEILILCVKTWWHAKILTSKINTTYNWIVTGESKELNAIHKSAHCPQYIYIYIYMPSIPALIHITMARARGNWLLPPFLDYYESERNSDISEKNLNSQAQQCSKLWALSIRLMISRCKVDRIFKTCLWNLFIYLL